jgi:hypothetical protein
MLCTIQYFPSILFYGRMSIYHEGGTLNEGICLIYLEMVHVEFYIYNKGSILEERICNKLKTYVTGLSNQVRSHLLPTDRS